MPNWIEGTLKLRGSKEKIENFLRNGIDYVDEKYFKNDDGKICIKRVQRENEIKIDKDQIYIEDAMNAYIKGTYRMFINKDKIERWWSDRDKEIIIIDIRQAWGFNSDDLVKLSKTWELDFYAYGIESGMEFCQIVEVINGELKKAEEIKFDNFEWECPDPRMGG